ncbi:MAG TPA: pyridoxamine 5'-phosphate oxidase family protein [Acidimicrobiales bacterium]|nr:pyridoxamine 5'-phosphate oxidase family protein [Acidimicrobiales bacterium]
MTTRSIQAKSRSGDLGRRLATRRRQLGLERAQVAARAGMDPGYLAYLEDAAGGSPSSTGLLRLAAALETTVEDLYGGGRDRAPGRGRPAAKPELVALSRRECIELLGAGGVGRFIFLEERGPVAVPVNFRMDGDDVVFRTEAGNSLSRRIGQRRVSFEVDQIDETRREGWSVLVSGVGRLVKDPAELEAVGRLGVAPWAGPDRRQYLRLVPEEITGRRIRVLD